MSSIKHGFTPKILDILRAHYGSKADQILDANPLLQYLNIKSRAANRGSKSRAGFANQYALYVLIEDYINKCFHEKGGYDRYDGAQFSALFRRQRELPFGSKLQNHALNHRLNEEFKKYFPTSQSLPIIRDAETNRYWVNENLLKMTLDDQQINLALATKKIIEAYIAARQSAFSEFMQYCQQFLGIRESDQAQAIEFIRGLLRPNVDARVFEIVSYAILKEHYAGQQIYWGWSPDELNTTYLMLYKTGRTNANDGGIDFVMQPLGRFFQVTETVDADKYFLDIDKVQRYPITFVVKSEDSVEAILARVQEQAAARYPIQAVVKRYMDCVEEVINIQELMVRYDALLHSGGGDSIVKEIILQSRIEFNVQTENDETIA